MGKQYRITAYGAFLPSRRFVVSTFCSCRRFDIVDVLSFDVLYVHCAPMLSPFSTSFVVVKNHIGSTFNLQNICKGEGITLDVQHLYTGMKVLFRNVANLTQLIS
jgi:hypothetical protein